MTRASIVVTSVIVASACQAGGLEIVVSRPADGTTVERVVVFVGTGSGSAAKIQPQGVAGELGGTAWQIDVPQLAPASMPARFTYEAGAIDTLGAVIAIGYANDQIVAAAHATGPIAIPSDHVDRITLAIDAASVLFPMHGSSNGAASVEVWQSDAAAMANETCALYQDPATGATTFLTYGEDRDCDGYADSDPRECVRDQYMSMRGPKTLPEMTCAQQTTVGGAAGAPVCVLGGPACVDGVGAMPGCSDSAYCVPPAACAACGVTRQGTPADLTCLEDMVRGGHPVTSAMFHVECIVHYVQGVMTASMCPGTATVSVDTTGIGYQCDNVAIRDASATGWSTQLALFGAQLDVSIASSSPCAITLALGSGTSPISPIAASALLAATVDNGVGARGAAVPVAFAFAPQATPCTGSDLFSCSVVSPSASDPFFACLRAPPPANTPAGGL